MILDGKSVSNDIINKVKKNVEKNEKKIGFAIIWVGDDPASSIYVNNKIKKCEYAGINAELHHLDKNTTEEDLLCLIDELNKRDDINGILLQSPTPEHINETNCFNRIDYLKDIDGFSNESLGNLVLGNPLNVSCTPKGIVTLLDYYNIDLTGKSVCLINRSNIVGKPLFHLLLERNATVTVCHSKTENISFYTKNADIVISAVGIPKFITADMIKEGSIIIDVGISRVDGKVVGDVDFESVEKKAGYITPVPGGIGPMTISMVLENLVNSYDEQILRRTR